MLDRYLARKPQIDLSKADEFARLIRTQAEQIPLLKARVAGVDRINVQLAKSLGME